MSSDTADHQAVVHQMAEMRDLARDRPNHDLIERPTKQAMLRGALGRCPACGQGRLFRSFLKVADNCPVCNEALHHQRADDGPAYLTILIVSHIGAPLLLASYVAWRPSAMTMITIFSLGAVVLSMLLLPRIKGAFVGLQWARRMHGFGFNAHGRRV